jgi:predicted AAA+ superfamily ATPase
MLAENMIEEVVLEQWQNLKQKPLGLTRDYDYSSITNNQLISVISGIRRSGKSTFLLQLTKYYESFYYINLDDERLLNFSVEDFQRTLLMYQKHFQSKTIFLDEIQNIANWERFIRRIYEEGYKIIITGSNANLLGSELATHLTGRYLLFEMFPFSFKEMLNYHQIDYSLIISSTKAAILARMDEYIQNGGFPEFVQIQNKDYLRQVYNDILYKDLIVRFNIKNHKVFKNLAQYLFTNFTKIISYNSLRKLLSISSVNTIKDYVDYLQQAYLVFECYKFDFSLLKQNTYDKKIYVVDNGLRNAVSFKFSADTSRQMENIVFLELKRRRKQVYFYKTTDNFDVDFLVHENPYLLIQVTYSMMNAETAQRELRALKLAMQELQVNQSIIITYNEEDIITDSERTIEIIPMWKWLLNK